MTHWSSDHLSAIGKLILSIEKIEAAGLPVSHDRLKIGQVGPSGEELAIDVVWIGPKDAESLLMETSGIHGVEGFAGSAIQLANMEDIANSASLPEGVAICMVHIINPYGMAWLRRVNESNVDLNRNFLLPGEKYEGEPEGYAALNGLMNPTSPPKSRRDSYLMKAALHILKHGYNNTKQALAEGQFTRPEGLQFGGFKLEEGPRVLIDWMKDNLGSVKRCVWIDLHTGLGKTGEDTLLVGAAPDSEKFADLKRRFGNRICSLDPSAGIGYKIHGGVQEGIEARFPEIEWTSLTQEFGTLNSIKVSRALRAENRWTQHGGKSGNEAMFHWSRSDLLNTFKLKGQDWERRLVSRGRSLFAEAMSDLTEE